MMATKGLARGPAEPGEPAEPPAQRTRPGLVTSGLGMQPSGPASPWRWFFSAIWLVYLIEPVSELFGHGHGVWWIAGGLAITITFCVAYVWLLVSSVRRLAVARTWLLGLAALAALACVVYGKDWTSLWIYVSAATGMVIAGTSGGRRAAMYGVIAVGACYVFFSWLSHDDPSDFFVVLLPVLLIGLAMIGFRLQMDLMQELAQARETVAKLAANDERLRLARDMHDLTGQSLSMITLKAELAAKRLARLEPSAERDAALTELGDIAGVSRQTLHDIREAVSGYRRPTLAIEAITARNALEAAGIQLDDDPGLTLRSGALDAEVEAVLAWCLREAVTNVIRHSGAQACRIRLLESSGELSLEIADDGHGPAPRAEGQEVPKGAGLRGMSERLSAAGGRLTLGAAEPGRGHAISHPAGAGTGSGFTLTATVPVDRYDR
jgi:two-component system, NarL family, sensor histidine kinase DesK